MHAVIPLNRSLMDTATPLDFGKSSFSNRISKLNLLRIAFLLLIYLLYLLTIPFLSFAAPPGSGSSQVPLVAVEKVTVRNINPPDEYVGHVEAIQSVDLRARVEGFLEKVNFKEGDHVSSGSLLYVIEQAPYRSQVDVDKAKVAQAEADLTWNTQHLKRLQSALPESIPAMDLDEAIADQLRAKAQLEEARASLTRSGLDLTYTMIHAPISGRIGRTSYTAGNLVGPSSDALARIVQMDPVRVVFSISENDLSVIYPFLENGSAKKENRSGLITNLRLSDGTIFNGNGRIDFVDNEVDSATGTIAVRAVFDNAEGRLIPGQYVNVLLTLAEPEMLPVVPQVAVQQDHEGSYVLLVDNDNRVVVRRIKSGPIIEDLWAVESGLNEGELVIVEGIQKVQPGMTVKTKSNDDRGGS